MPLNVEAEVAWAGYANARIRAQIEPLLQQALRARGWIGERWRRARPRRRSSRRCGRGALFERGASICRVARAGAARRDGRHRRLLRVARAAAPDRRSDVRGRAATRSPGPGDRQPRPAAVHDSARGAGAGRRAGRATTRRGGCSHDERRTDWAAYVAGVFLVLARERGLPLTVGRAESSIASQVPEGKGVSSSAAVETASMHAVGDARSALPLEPRDLALLCQKAENLVAGAPCGVMDQMTCVFGERERAAGAALSAGRTAAAGAAFRMTSSSGESTPASVTPWAAPTTAPCATGAFMGLRILAEHVVGAGRLSGQHRARGVRAASS